MALADGGSALPGWRWCPRPACWPPYQTSATAQRRDRPASGSRQGQSHGARAQEGVSHPPARALHSNRRSRELGDERVQRAEVLLDVFQQLAARRLIVLPAARPLASWGRSPVGARSRRASGAGTAAHLRRAKILPEQAVVHVACAPGWPAARSVGSTSGDTTTHCRPYGRTAAVKLDSALQRNHLRHVALALRLRVLRHGRVKVCDVRRMVLLVVQLRAGGPTQPSALTRGR